PAASKRPGRFITDTARCLSFDTRRLTPLNRNRATPGSSALSFRMDFYNNRYIKTLAVFVQR
ncbi:hypothetical protein, partial [Pseudomonas aeruginosa]|uniref:hypothetical protein n=1 Tax=Pseudomonas aeruginosa TaxID=287 RepID=UPI001ABCECF7